MVIKCWWNLVLARIRITQGLYDQAEQALQTSYDISSSNSYRDFLSEYYYGEALLCIYTQKQPNYYIEKAISLSSDNLYVSIKCQILKLYYNFVICEESLNFNDMIVRIRLLIDQTGYLHLKHQCDLINLTFLLKGNKYYFDDLFEKESIEIRDKHINLLGFLKIIEYLRSCGDQVLTEINNLKELF